MMHKLLIAAAIVAVVVLGVAWYQMPSVTAVDTPDQTADVDAGGTSATSSTSGLPSSTGSSQTGGGSSGGTTSGPKTYTTANVAQHGNQSSCWSAINGKVYNLTSWINQHPGGPERILSICGTDGSSAFNAQHSGARKPQEELANFYIGALQ